MTNFFLTKGKFNIKNFTGELRFDKLTRSLYATDASIYKEYPIAVCFPKNKQDIQLIINYAREQGLSIIPRAAGTSLAGQCVGDGIVVDISRYMNKIIEVNKEEKWVKVEPGVIRDELNAFLRPLGLFFGPNTSTANRCMIGGMVGNNSCGSTSIVYGSTRDHVISLSTILSNGEEAIFSTLSPTLFEAKLNGDKLENKIYQQIFSALSSPEQQKEIKEEFPHPSIERRNTGYAIDLLLSSNIFTPNGSPFNFAQLLCGSEGTLAFTTEIQLNLVDLPPSEDVVLCAHFNSIEESLQANIIAMQHRPSACELMDDSILELSKQNPNQIKNRSFVLGQPAALLLVEFRANDSQSALKKAHQLVDQLKKEQLGFAFPILTKPDTNKAWNLRKAGLGILGNMVGDKKAVACIEDTAVTIENLPKYIEEFTQMMEKHQQKAIYYAHAGHGEIHLRPILNLKDKADRQALYDITFETAKLVKKYKGSFSGEHGDGRVRAPFIEYMIGKNNYQLLREIKQTWDPHNIFNPGKIIDSPPMNSHLRYPENYKTPEFNTFFNYSSTGGFMRTIEKCNGSGDCRKLPLSGGTMCPSYQATKNEQHSTRGRANVLRNLLSEAPTPTAFDQKELIEALDLCLSCKACASECPSSIDMAKFKTEILQQYYRHHRRPLRNSLFSYFFQLNNLASTMPQTSRFLMTNKWTSLLFKLTLGIATQRQLPTLALTPWYDLFHQQKLSQPDTPRKTVYLLCDEFTHFTDAHIGQKTVRLLTSLGYKVILSKPLDSGRAAFSKGHLSLAIQLAQQNIQQLHPLINEETPLIGIEPSSILSFKDEYLKLNLSLELQSKAKHLAKNTFTVEEFLANEVRLQHISSDQFHQHKKNIYLHIHCHQKALTNTDDIRLIAALPTNYTIKEIPSGCCGMAGSFGYEKEHYKTSMDIGELVLFPTIRKTKTEDIIIASGTSCRHQIKDGTQRQALHIVELLESALK